MPHEDGSPLRVLVTGGGVAALEATLALRKLAEERVAIELVAPETEFVYRPMSVAEPFRVGEMRRFPLERLVEDAGGRLRRGRVVGVDTHRRVVFLASGGELPYDVLLLALGARPVEAVPGALTFRGPADEPAIAAMLDDALKGKLHRIVFAVPFGGSWPLPLYELMLLTSNYLTDRGAVGRDFALVTPEDEPLGLFGDAASAAVAELLSLRGIELHLRTVPARFEEGELHVVPEARLAADCVVALPKLEGIPLAGIPHDAEGFVATDDHARVRGLDDVYAAGDLTTYPVKQGGIAAQQADVAAAAIAARAGAPVTPTPFAPVLRGQLLTGIFPRYLRGDAAARTSTISTQALWWPPAKIVGRHLAPFLAPRLGLADELRERAAGVPVDVALEPKA